MLPSPAEATDLLLIKPSSLGDIVHALPCAEAIKAAHPHLALRWVVDPRFAPLIEDHPLLEAIIPFPRSTFRGVSGIARALRWAGQLRASAPETSGTPEFGVDLQGLLRSALIGHARRCNPLVGPSDAREGAPRLYHFVATVDPAAHAVDRYLSVLDQLGIPPPAAPHTPHLPPGTPVETPGIDLSSAILIHPYSRGQGKSLDPIQIAHIAQALQPCPVILVGQRGEAPPPLLPHGCLDLSDHTSIAQLIYLLRHALFTISVDSGPAHLASALAVPLLAIHTWTDPRKVGPYHPGALVWKAGQIRPSRHWDDAEAKLSTPPSLTDLSQIAATALALTSHPQHKLRTKD